MNRSDQLHDIAVNVTAHVNACRQYGFTDKNWEKLDGLLLKWRTLIDECCAEQMNAEQEKMFEEFCEKESFNDYEKSIAMQGWNAHAEQGCAAPSPAAPKVWPCEHVVQDHWRFCPFCGAKRPPTEDHDE